MRFPYLLLFPFLLSLAACSTVSDSVSSFMGGEDNTRPPTPLQDVSEKIKINRLWDESIGDGSDEKYLKLLPVYFNGRIYAAESDGDISAIDSKSGKTLWTRDVDIRITGGPGAGEDLVMVGTGEADTIALSAESGEIAWQSKVSSEVLAAPQVADNIVVVRTIDGKLFGLNAADGSRKWIYDRSVPTLTLRGTSSPVIKNGLVIAGFDEGRLTAIELLTGNLIWETRIALGSGRTELERMVDIDAEPVIRDGIIYVATFQGRIAALTLDTGRIIWTRDISSYAGISVDDNNVYISDDESAVWALNRENGNSVWKQEALVARAVTAPALNGNAVVVGDVEGYLHWLDRNTGEFLGRNRLSSSQVLAPPVSVDGVIYAYASDGTLGAFTYLDNPDYVPPSASEEVATDTGDASEDGTATGEETAAGGETAAEAGPVQEEESLLKKMLNVFTGDDEE